MDIICQTPRLILRRLTLADAVNLLNLNNNPDVLKYLHEPALNHIADAEKVLQDIIFPQYTLYELGRWGVIYKTQNKFLGWCGLKRRPELNDEIDLGYRFNPEHWGQGFATEAATACLRYGFIEKKLHTITGRAHIENTASLNVLQKIGLQYIKEEIVDDCPVKTYQLTREEYLAIQAEKQI